MWGYPPQKPMDVDPFFIKNHQKSIFWILGNDCIFLVRKNHEISTSQRVCRWSVALFSSIFVFFMGVSPPIVTWDDPPPTHFGKGCLPGLSLHLPSCLSRLPKLCQIFANPFGPIFLSKIIKNQYFGFLGMIASS